MTEGGANATTDLVVFNVARDEQPAWPHGRVHVVDASSTGGLIAHVGRPDALNADELWFWDARLGRPDPSLVDAFHNSPDDVWHAGLALGTCGLPRAIDFVAPTWMLNRDPDPAIEATSWRLTLRNCLVRAAVVRDLGFLDPGFNTLLGAGLELGHRWHGLGAQLRHVPTMVQGRPTMPDDALTVADELRFVHRRMGRKWLVWAGWRAARTGSGVRTVVTAAAREYHESHASSSTALSRPGSESGRADEGVAVIIPTIERYPYLHTVLSQLRTQTVQPSQIIVIDQSPPSVRDTALRNEFADLPLRWVELDTAGQSTARNVGLEHVSVPNILFLDDDIEMSPDLVARHLSTLTRRRADACSGVAVEPGTGPTPKGFSLERTSDVLPGGNSLVRRQALDATGLFDLAFDTGPRADHDLGMRLYLSGARMVLDPDISVLHHRAPRGGLRVHGARATTYATSRRSLVERQQLAATEIYLARRYFTAAQVDEMVRLRKWTGFVHGGRGWRRVARAAVQLALLPSTSRRFRAAMRQADELAVAHPIIPPAPWT